MGKNNPEIIDTTKSMLYRSWDGSDLKGRYWIDKILAKVSELLTPGGMFFMIAIHDNQPNQILELAKNSYGLLGEIILCKRTSLEHLYGLKFVKMQRD